MLDKPPVTPRPLPVRLPRVCVPVIGDNPLELIERAEQLASDNSLLEFRLDYLKQPAAAFQALKRFLTMRPHVVAIATCRRVANGGKFRGSLASEVDVLTKAAAAGCQIVDLELESARSLKAAELNKLRTRAAVLLSYHDFRATRKLDEVFKNMSAIPAEIYKLVSTATSLYDNVVMMKFVEDKSRQHSLVGLCMGEQGIISRVLVLRAGSLFTFAAASPGEETAPGQITARSLRELYRIDTVDAATRAYGVVGNPVEHSLSPLMMNAAFRRENVNAVYLPLHATTLNDALRCIRGVPIHGVSVTMPYKQAIVEHLDNCDPYTHKTGACNTVIRSQDGKLYGFNTDVAGVVRPLEQRITLNGARVLVIGAGGAARAAVFGLRERGAEVFILNRTAEKAQKLARQAKARTIKRAEVRKQNFDVIINATPVGMNGRDCPLEENEINTKIAFDMVYAPAETPFLARARARGAQVIPGVEMFVQQGARQFEIWTGKPAPVDEMQRMVLTALEARGAEQKVAGNGKTSSVKKKARPVKAKRKSR